jgi:hypothetical protein
MTSLNLTLAAWKEMVEDSKIIVAVFWTFRELSKQSTGNR